MNDKIFQNMDLDFEDFKKFTKGELVTLLKARAKELARDRAATLKTEIKKLHDEISDIKKKTNKIEMQYKDKYVQEITTKLKTSAVEIETRNVYVNQVDKDMEVGINQYYLKLRTKYKMTSTELSLYTNLNNKRDEIKTLEKEFNDIKLIIEHDKTLTEHVKCYMSKLILSNTKPGKEVIKFLEEAKLI